MAPNREAADETTRIRRAGGSGPPTAPRRGCAAKADAGDSEILDPDVTFIFDAFVEGMRDLGYVEGQNIAYVRKDCR